MPLAGVDAIRIDQLATFLSVADERSYTRAAERLNLSQPAVYQQIRQLEQQIGQKLCYVVGKEVLLTSAGRALYGFAARVGQEHEQLLQELNRLREASRQLIRIGSVSYYGVLPIAAERVAARYPGTVVEYHSLHPPEAMEKIHAGELDFGFFGPAFSPQDLVADPILEQRIVVAVTTQHELAACRRMDAADLQRFPVIGYTRGSAQAAIDAWYARRPELQISYAARGDSSMAIRAMALSMHVPALITAAAVREDVLAGRMRVLDIPDFDVSYTLYAVHRGREKLSRIAAAYLDELIGLGRRER